jgi:hypothetical protein
MASLREREEAIAKIFGRTASYREREGFQGIHYSNRKEYQDIYKNPDQYAITTKSFAPGTGYESTGMMMEGMSENEDLPLYVFKKREDKPATTDTDTNTGTNTDTDTNTGGTSEVVNNPYQGQIDTLTTQLGTISGQIGGYTDTINTLRGQISDMQTNFGNQLKTIMDANTKALEDMNTQYQTQLREQQEAQEAARRQRELAAQTAAANQARAGQQAEFQLGSGMMRGIFGGLAGFKRRGKVKASTSDALSIAGNTEKSPNKMLNV